MESVVNRVKVGKPVLIKTVLGLILLAGLVFFISKSIFYAEPG